MKNRIVLPELENPINSNFKEESFTGHLVCVGVAIATFIIC